MYMILKHSNSLIFDKSRLGLLLRKYILKDAYSTKTQF
jgi:hypothetical protein